jgi:hypothetical protein
MISTIKMSADTLSLDLEYWLWASDSAGREHAENMCSSVWLPRPATPSNPGHGLNQCRHSRIQPG